MADSLTRQRSPRSANRSAGTSALRARLYTAVLTVAVVAGAAALLLRGFELPAWIVVAIFVVLAVIGEWQRQDLPGSSTALSLTSILLAASIALLGPLGAAVIGLVGLLLSPAHLKPLVRVFNAVMTGLLGLVGGAVYVLSGGMSLLGGSPNGAALVWHGLMPLVLATLAGFVVNVLLVGGMITITTGTPLLQTTRGMVSIAWLQYIWYGLVGFLFAVLWGPADLGVVSVAVMVAPLILAQGSLVQQHEEREVHERTIESLVAAVEARDPMMRGHSARVAAVSAVVGDELRLSPKRARALQFAAMLHDIGLVGPRPRATIEENRLSRADLQRIRQHPARGVEMLRGIDFLAEALDAIGHHHERWDGLGFPSHLGASNIPLLSRILAVADGYCALTVPRADHDALSSEEAICALRGRVGTQFDVDCVEALARGAGRVERALHELADEQAPLASGIDHDLPEISDRMAGLRSATA